MRLIRKISIGPNYRESMHYLHGQSVLGGKYTIHLIRQIDNGDIQIHIEGNDEVVLWKVINSTVPFVIEHDIDF